MAKKQRSVSLTFVLLRFAVVMLGCMLLCGLVWMLCFTQLRNAGIIYQGYVSNQQTERILTEDTKNFISPGADFLPEYALFAPDGNVLESNVEGKKLETLREFFLQAPDDVHVSRRTYADGSTVIIQWYFRSEFVNPILRNLLPPFEYLWLAVLGAGWVLCLIFNTLRLRRHLAARLRLFGEVSDKVGAQELDFTVPHAGIREYAQALDAMEHMREALYSSLSSQWAAQQEREAEIAALAHDLKTPLTLIGGSAELLLVETLSENCQRMVETIVSNSDRAKRYVASLLETSSGTDETFENTALPTMFDELCLSANALAQASGGFLHSQNSLEGSARIQKDHLLRALGNVVQNAIEHTPEGGSVYLEGCMLANGWQITVRDEGPGFSRAALHHATERLWRDDTARSSDGHNGLGLWFAAQVVTTHSGQLELKNCESGGMAVIKFRRNL